MSYTEQVDAILKSHSLACWPSVRALAAIDPIVKAAMLNYECGGNDREGALCLMVQHLVKAKAQYLDAYLDETKWSTRPIFATKET